MRRTLLTLAVLGSLASVGGTAAQAAASTPLVQQEAAPAHVTVQPVQYWRHRWERHRYWRHRRWCYHHPGACY